MLLMVISSKFDGTNKLEVTVLGTSIILLDIPKIMHGIEKSIFLVSHIVLAGAPEISS